jgi:hypothetical protein
MSSRNTCSEDQSGKKRFNPPHSYYKCTLPYYKSHLLPFVKPYPTITSACFACTTWCVSTATMHAYYRLIAVPVINAQLGSCAEWLARAVHLAFLYASWYPEWSFSSNYYTVVLLSLTFSMSSNLLPCVSNISIWRFQNF